MNASKKNYSENYRTEPNQNNINSLIQEFSTTIDSERNKYSTNIGSWAAEMILEWTSVCAPLDPELQKMSRYRICEFLFLRDSEDEEEKINKQ